MTRLGRVARERERVCDEREARLSFVCDGVWSRGYTSPSGLPMQKEECVQRAKVVRATAQRTCFGSEALPTFAHSSQRPAVLAARALPLNVTLQQFIRLLRSRESRARSVARDSTRRISKQIKVLRHFEVDSVLARPNCLGYVWCRKLCCS